MTKIEQFESVFKAAVRTPYEFALPNINHIMLATDLPAHEVADFQAEVKNFLSILGPEIQWQVLSADDFTSVQDLLDQAKQHNPDLICTYRHLHNEGWKWPYGLGTHVISLIQTPDIPVLILPHPKSEAGHAHILENTNSITVITDHLTGNHALVNFAIKFTESGGSLFLTHVEDSANFERYIDIISKIPGLDTEIARNEIYARLLKEPHDYVLSCSKELQDRELSIKIEEVVKMGHRLTEYKRLIEDHEVDLLVMNAKEDDQIAIHGLAYPLLVELRSIPVLVI